MANKGNDINLFKAASKSDKKIQTGVSKSFMFVILGFVLIVAIGAYIGMIYVGNQAIEAELAVITSYNTYSDNINTIAAKISDDRETIASIQADIDAAMAIKHYALNTSILYPGLTANQGVVLFSKTYIEESIEKAGCVPDGVVYVNQASIIKIYTNGIDSFQVSRFNESDSQYYATNVIYPKGYVLMRFECANESDAQVYVDNIIEKAASTFAIENGIAIRDVITPASFEVGIVSLPSSSNSNYVMFIKCKLKSVFQIIMEDQYLTYYRLSNPVLNFTGDALTIELSTREKSVYEIAGYLYSTGLFTNIDYTGETMNVVTNEENENEYHYEGSIICTIKEAN